MAAHEHIQPEQLRTLANEHGDKHFKNFRDPKKREIGMCYDYSEHFSKNCGLPAAHVQPYDLGDSAHAVNLVTTSHGPYVVDFTYNQFDPQAQVPVVEPQSRYEQRFSDVKRGKTYKYEGEINLK
jgi:hypothetical protein